MTDKMKRRLCTAVFTLSLISMAVFTVMYVKTQKEYRHSERDIAAVMEIRGAISPALTINEKSRLDEASLRAAEYESAQERREGCRLLKEIDQIETVLPTQLELLDPVPGREYMTLFTCTPYGINSHRLLVRGVRIPYEVTSDGTSQEAMAAIHIR